MENEYLAYISKDNSVYYLNVKQFNRQWIEVCDKKIYDISVSSNLNYLAALCDNNHIKIIDYQKNVDKWKFDNYIQSDEVGDILYDEITEYLGQNSGTLKALAFTPDSKYLVFVGKSVLEHYDIYNKQIITMKNS